MTVMESSADADRPADRDDGGLGAELERFPASAGRWFGYVAIVAVAFLAVDVVRKGIDASGALGLAVLLGGSVCIYMVMVRPQAIAYAAGLRVKRLASDVDVPWSRLERALRRQTLRIETDSGVVHCVAAPRSARAMLISGGRWVDRAQERDYMADRIMEYSIAHGEDPVAQAPVTRRWAWPEILLLGMATLAALVAWLGIR
jgi:hypothetical protein